MNIIKGISNIVIKHPKEVATAVGLTLGLAVSTLQNTNAQDTDPVNLQEENTQNIRESIYKTSFDNFISQFGKSPMYNVTNDSTYNALFYTVSPDHNPNNSRHPGDTEIGLLNGEIVSDLIRMGFSEKDIKEIAIETLQRNTREGEYVNPELVEVDKENYDFVYHGENIFNPASITEENGELRYLMLSKDKGDAHKTSLFVIPRNILFNKFFLPLEKRLEQDLDSQIIFSPTDSLEQKSSQLETPSIQGNFPQELPLDTTEPDSTYKPLGTLSLNLGLYLMDNPHEYGVIAEAAFDLGMLRPSLGFYFGNLNESNELDQIVGEPMGRNGRIPVQQPTEIESGYQTGISLGIGVNVWKGLNLGLEYTIPFTSHDVQTIIQERVNNADGTTYKWGGNYTYKEEGKRNPFFGVSVGYDSDNYNAKLTVAEDGFRLTGGFNFPIYNRHDKVKECK